MDQGIQVLAVPLGPIHSVPVELLPTVGFIRWFTVTSCCVHAIGSCFSLMHESIPQVDGMDRANGADCGCGVVLYSLAAVLEPHSRCGCPI